MFVFYVIAALILLLFLVSLMVPKEMKIEKQVTVSRPAGEVFDFLKLIRNQDQFSVWNKADPGMKKETEGTDGEVGFIYRWDSATNKNVGAGEQEIKEISPGKSITCELRFLRPMQDVASTRFEVSDAGQGMTRIQWGFYGRMKPPMTLMKPVFTKMLGKDLEKGLENLKNILG